MNSILRISLPALTAAFALGVGVDALRAEDKPATAAPQATAGGGAKRFDAKEAALAALIQALESNDDAALEGLVGPGNADLVQSGKDPYVARERKRVAGLAKEKATWEELDDGTLVAVLGPKDWPMPIPLAPKDGAWFWDAEQGRDELLARRIGANELAVMDLLREIVDAQVVYKAKDRDGDGVLEFAQKFVSSAGTKDGLYWEDPEDVSLEDRSPVGAMIAALGEGAVEGRKQGDPWSGYVFKLLTSQGACAPGGEGSWLEGANLTRGWGVLAIPAEHRITGVKSFIISHRGRLFERDLGPKGAEVAKGITTFQPDRTWVRVGNP
jgi:hypothetical protein